MQIVFPLADNAFRKKHTCEVQVKGDWIVYTCKECPGYERRVHRRTGKVFEKGSANRHVHHVHQQRKPK